MLSLIANFRLYCLLQAIGRVWLQKNSIKSTLQHFFWNRNCQFFDDKINSVQDLEDFCIEQ